MGSSLPTLLFKKGSVFVRGGVGGWGWISDLAEVFSYFLLWKNAITSTGRVRKSHQRSGQQ